MMLYGKQYGGADPQLIEGDIFQMIVTVPEFGENPAEIPDITQVGAEVKAHDTPEVTPEVMKMLGCMSGEMTRGEIMQRLGLKDEKHFREQYQQTGIRLGIIEMTIPDKPRSSKQKYRITEKGKKMLQGL